jgi:hypothetical protein
VSKNGHPKRIGSLGRVHGLEVQQHHGHVAVRVRVPPGPRAHSPPSGATLQPQKQTNESEDKIVHGFVNFVHLREGPRPAKVSAILSSPRILLAD